MKRKREKRDYTNTKPQGPPAKFKAGFLAALDRRTEVFAILHGNYEEIMADMGGPDNLSHVHKALAERFTFLEFVLQNLEYKIAQRGSDSAELIGRWIQGVNSLSGLAKSIGLERRAKPIVSLKAYVKKQKRK